MGTDTHCFFNSQPHEEADHLTFLWLRPPSLFNSQPHEEADIGTIAPDTIVKFSTHSLTKRLTGASYVDSSGQSLFNSQPHEEADGIFNFSLSFLRNFSTHSLTKRLTIISDALLSFLKFFNSQPHEEADELR